MKKIVLFSNLMFASTLIGMQDQHINDNSAKNKECAVSETSLSQSVNDKNLDRKGWLSRIFYMKKIGLDFNIFRNAAGQNILMLATQYADSYIMEQILNLRDDKGQRCVDVNTHDINGHTALSLAANLEDDSKITLLLHNGAQIDLVQSKVLQSVWEKLRTQNRLVQQIRQDKWQRLFHAIVDNNISKLKQLIKTDPNIDVINDKGENNKSLLMLAIDLDRYDMAKLLLSQPRINVNLLAGNPAYTALSGAILANKTRMVELLLSHKQIDVNAKIGNGYTALMEAIATKNKHITELLLNRADVDVNVQHKTYGDTALTFASTIGFKEGVEMLLAREEINVNMQNTKGCTALICSIPRCKEDVPSNNYRQITKLLLNRQDIDVNKTDICGRTALMIAMIQRCTPIVRQLLDHQDIDVNHQDNKGYSALMLSVVRDDRESIKLLLQRPDIDVNPITQVEQLTPLMFSIWTKNTEVIRWLLNRSDINIHSRDCADLLPLWVASCKGMTDVVEMLLNKNESESYKEKGSNTSETNILFEIAVKFGHTDTARLLLDKGADVNRKYENGMTPLMYAVLCDNIRLVNLLLNQPNIDLYATNDDGETVLQIAQEKKHESRIKRLLQLKMNPEKDYVGHFGVKVSSSHIKNINEKFLEAVSKGDVQTMDNLLNEDDSDGEMLVNVNCTNAKGETPLIIAAQKGILEAVQLLVANSDIANKALNGDNALICATRAGSFDVVLELLTRGAMINTSDKAGNTPLMIAAQGGDDRLVKLLITKGAKIGLKNRSDKTALDLVQEKLDKLSKPGTKNDKEFQQLKSVKQILQEKSDSIPNQLLDEFQAPDIEIPWNLKNKWDVNLGKCEKDLASWEKDVPAIYNKIQKMIKKIQRHPLDRSDKFKQLTGDLSGLYSRRIDAKNRLIYEIDGEKIILVSCKGHGEKLQRKTYKNPVKH